MHINVQQIASINVLPMQFVNKEEHLTFTKFLDGISHANVTLPLSIAWRPTCHSRQTNGHGASSPSLPPPQHVPRNPSIYMCVCVCTYVAIGEEMEGGIELNAPCSTKCLARPPQPDPARRRAPREPSPTRTGCSHSTLETPALPFSISPTSDSKKKNLLPSPIPPQSLLLPYPILLRWSEVTKCAKIPHCCSTLDSQFACFVLTLF